MEKPDRNMVMYGGTTLRWCARHTSSAFKMGPGYPALSRLRTKLRHLMSHFFGTKKYVLPTLWWRDRCVLPRELAGENNSFGYPDLRSSRSSRSFEPAICDSKRSCLRCSTSRSFASFSCVHF